MRTALFVAIVLASGALAGLVHGSANLLIVEPYLDDAIEMEARGLIASGLEEDTPVFWAEHGEYRAWQKGGQVLAGVILGVSAGSLFGIVYALSRGALPARGDVRKALMLAGMMWATVYLVPFLKYPATLPGAGDGETVVLRSILYLSLVAMSGLAAVGAYRLSTRLRGRRKLLALACYAAFVAAAFAAMPGNPEGGSGSPEALNWFRAMTVVGVSSFWAAVGLALGALWHRYRPHDHVAPYG